MSVRLNGSTSGYVELDAPAVAGNNTLRLPSGASPAGSVLQVDGAGQMSWRDGAALSGTKNRIINGEMQIDQRNGGASVNASGAFPVDRFSQGLNGTGVITCQRSTTAPAGFTNSIQATVTTADSSLVSTDEYFLAQMIEGFNVADFDFGLANAKTITVSFWVRSSLTGSFGFSLKNSGVTRTYPTSYTINTANSWEYKTITIPGDTTGTWLKDNARGLECHWSLGAQAGYKTTGNAWTAGNFSSASGTVDWISTSGATFFLTGVQVELGSVATPFERRSYGQELALCQRYYEEVDGQFKFDGNLGGATISVGHTWFCQVSKRSTPTVSVVSQSGGNSNNISSVSPKSNNGAYCIWEYTSGAAVVARSKAAVIRFVAEV